MLEHRLKEVLLKLDVTIDNGLDAATKITDIDEFPKKLATEFKRIHKGELEIQHVSRKRPVAGGRCGHAFSNLLK